MAEPTAPTQAPPAPPSAPPPDLRGRNKPTHPRRTAAKIFSQQVLEARIRGFSFNDICESLGKSKGGVIKAYQRAMAEAAKDLAETAAQARLVEVRRLDMYLNKLQKRIESGDTAAIHRALKISERRARLLGLDLQPEPFGYNPNPGAGIPTQIAVVFVGAGADNRLLNPPTPAPGSNGHAPPLEFVAAPSNGKEPRKP